MTIRRALALITVMTIVLVGGLASPAQAQDAKPASCGASLLCLYTGDGYTGSRQDQYARANGVCDGVLYNDQLSSVWNGTGKSVRFYNDAGCTGGGAFSVTPGTGSPRMSVWHPTSNDETTSFKWGA